MRLALIFIAIISLAMVPIIGNQLVKEKLETNLKLLTDNGIAVQKNKEKSTYLNTSRHYELVVKDTKRFLTYLSKYSAKQLPRYSSSLLSGTVIGIDIEYSNIPFTEDISVDRYPL